MKLKLYILLMLLTCNLYGDTVPTYMPFLGADRSVFKLYTPAPIIVVPNGLVSYWKLDSTNINDSVGTNQGLSWSMTMTNGPKGLSDTAIQVVPGAQIEIADSTTLDFTNGTISLWWKSTQNSINIGCLGKSAWNGVGVSYLLMMYNGYSYFYFYGTGGGYIGRTSNPGTQFNDGLWHHIVVTYGGGTDSSSIMIYKDTIRVDVADYADETFTSPLLNSQPLYFSVYLGLWMDNSTFSQIRFYDRVLATNEISTIYNAEK